MPLIRSSSSFLPTTMFWLASLFFAGRTAQAYDLSQTTEVWWTLTYVEDVNPDGRFARRAIGVNGTWPPPPLSVPSTHTLVLHATNELDEPATLHHHGMFFTQTSWMDGAEGVSSCGIPPGETSTYIVPIAADKHWGSFWIHAHSEGHYPDGLRTSLVINAPNEVHKYDQEYTVTLGDWYHDQHSVLIDQFINVNNPEGVEPVPESGLIYFSQEGKYLPPISSTTPHITTSATGFNENATISFEPGKTYRLRVINTSTFAMFSFWVDGHDMRIIEADGTDVKEYPIGTIALSVGQRYSILVTARNETSSNWAIHANMDPEMFDEPSPFPNVTSSITYNVTAPLIDLGFIDEYEPTPDIDLVPIEPMSMPAATRTLELEAEFVLGEDGINRGVFNEITWTKPIVPAIFSAMSLGRNATNEEEYGAGSFVVNSMEVIDIVIKNADDGSHPFHLHGHKPMLVGRSEDYTSDDPILNPPIVEGQLNPMRRDVFQIPSMGSVTLRIVADNPGIWLMHCHIEWHFSVGLVIQLIEAPLELQKHNSIPSAFYDQCKAEGIPTSGGAREHPLKTKLKPVVPLLHSPEGSWVPRYEFLVMALVIAFVFAVLRRLWRTRGVKVDGGVEEERLGLLTSMLKGRRIEHCTRE